MPDRIWPIHVLLIDSRPVVLLGLSDLINHKKPLMEVVGCASSYARALDLADDLLPDVILFHFFPDALEGIEVLAALARRKQTKVLVLKGLYENISLDKAVEVGARGVVLAEDPTESITRAIVKVHEHDRGSNRAWTGGLSAYATREHINLSGDPEHAKQALLTHRELELIQAITASPSDKYMSIAHRLGISEHTVHNHLSSIYHKLNVVNRIDLLVYALKHGLVTHTEAAESAWVELQ
jgi:two-component system, NarL family, response regulator LiaR